MSLRKWTYSTTFEAVNSISYLNGGSVVPSLDKFSLDQAILDYLQLSLFREGFGEEDGVSLRESLD